MNHTIASLLALTLLGAATTAEAQGTITNGDAAFEITSFGTTGPASVDMTVTSGGDDHLFDMWWWYRLPGDTDEVLLPAPDTEDYTGSVATLSWTDVDTSGLDMELVATLTTTGTGQATITQVLTVTNTNTTPTLFNAFAYADIDLDGTAGGDTGTAGASATELIIMDSSTGRFIGTGADAFQVDEFPAIEDLFDDTLVTTLDNSGAAFPTGDWSGAYQWTTTIAASASQSFTAAVEVTEVAVALDGGVAPDSGIVVADAGIGLDAGTAADGGATTDDAGVTADAGTAADAGPTADAGATADAGTTPTADAGTTPMMDAGTTPMADAGTTPGVDSGTGPDPMDDGGCSCRVQTDPTPSSGGPLLALLAIGALVLRRRRAR